MTLTPGALEHSPHLDRPHQPDPSVQRHHRQVTSPNPTVCLHVLTIVQPLYFLLNRMQQLRYGGASSPRMVNNCRFKDFRFPSHQNINPYCVCACQVPRSKLIFIIPLFVHRNPSTLGCGVRRLATCSGNPPNVDQISLPISSPEDICRER